MRIILDTTSSNPDYYGDCDCAVVDLTPALVDQIRRRAELTQRAAGEDPDLYELYFWCGGVDFYDYNLVEACGAAVAAAAVAKEEDRNAAEPAWHSALEQNGHALLPPGVDLQPHQPQRVECSQMILRRGPRSDAADYEVAWTVIPKHTDIYVTTRDLPLAAINAYLLGSEKRASRARPLPEDLGPQTE